MRPARTILSVSRTCTRCVARSPMPVALTTRRDVRHRVARRPVDVDSSTCRSGCVDSNIRRSTRRRPISVPAARDDARFPVGHRRLSVDRRPGHECAIRKGPLIRPMGDDPPRGPRQLERSARRACGSSAPCRALERCARSSSRSGRRRSPGQHAPAHARRRWPRLACPQLGDAWSSAFP